MEASKKEKAINAGRRTILPGLIDMHTHQVHRRPYEWYFNSPYGLAKSTLLAMHNSAKWIKAGITTVRDYCGDMPGIVALRDEVSAGRILGPRFVFVNDHEIGGKGSQEVEERVKEVVKLGVSDWIGVGVTGGYTSNQPLVMKRTFDEVETAVKVAHASGKKVDAMVENAEGCKLSIKAGVDCMTHGMLLDDESLKMMREANMYRSPILLTRAASCELDLTIPDSDVNMSGLPQPDKLKWIQTMKDRLKVLKKNVKKAHEMGIKMIVGSDIPPPRVETVIIQNDAMVT